MATAAQFLAAARRELGTVESPPGSNRNPYSASLGRPPQPWCADFVVWVARAVGMTLPSESAYTPAMANGFKRIGRYGDTPRVGALAFYHWPSMGRIAHVGIVEAVRGDGSIIAIEGNTDSRGGRTGGRVMRQVRRAYIDGFGYPLFSGARPSAPAPRPSGAPVAQQLPTIRRGARGNHVRALQGLLVAARHDLVVDGEFGPATDYHVRTYQRARGLVADGVVGDKTWTRLLYLA